MNVNEQIILVKDCPMCGGRLERKECQQDNFYEYACPDCGLNWQSCVEPNAQTQPKVPHGWMWRLSRN
jgi:hypothetical protein